MAKLNTKVNPIYTHEGAKAQHINPELQLRRSVMSCMLWEREFYEDGESIADRIKNIIPKVSPEKVVDIAIEAREKMKLRHVPLLIVREMARLDTHKKFVEATLSRVIQRPDELTEFLAIYWKDKKQPLSAQVKKGLAAAFTKFNEYQLAKYNRADAIKLRDVLFLCHAKPKDKEQGGLWKRLVDKKLQTPDTWEVALSGGVDKKEAFERLLKEGKLGALALLRNLRNMSEAKVDETVIFGALNKMNIERVLPFRFITAARYAPQWEDKLEIAMMKCLSSVEKLSGKTILLIDVSGSMDSTLSNRSEVNRRDVASGLGILAREIFDCQIITFSNKCVLIPARHGFALRDAIENSQEHRNTYLGQAIQLINEKFDYDRIIVITDEQSHDSVPSAKGKAYLINVASNQNGIGYGDWIHIDGWSEATLEYIRTVEEAIEGGVINEN